MLSTINVFRTKFKMPGIMSFMGQVVIIEAHDVPTEFGILLNYLKY